MKNNFLILILFAVAVGFVACKSESKAGAAGTETSKANTAAKAGEEVLQERTTKSVATLYDMDVTNTTVSWKANKKIGSGHSGTFNASMGRLAYDQGRVVAGEVNIDMKSIAVTDDMGADMKGKLLGHLQTGDFFEIEKFPSAQFVFQKIQPETDASNGYNYTIAGPLTIKGVSKPVTIPANIDVQSGKIVVNSPVFTINRTDWGINYGSGILGTAADKIIKDEVEMTINAVFLAR